MDNIENIAQQEARAIVEEHETNASGYLSNNYATQPLSRSARKRSRLLRYARAYIYVTILSLLVSMSTITLNIYFVAIQKELQLPSVTFIGAAQTASAGVIMWRFWGAGRSYEHIKLRHRREKRSNLMMGGILFLIGLLSLVYSILSVLRDTAYSMARQIIYLNSSFFSGFLILSLVKFQLYRVLRSDLLYQDMIITLFGVFCALFGIIGYGIGLDFPSTRRDLEVISQCFVGMTLILYFIYLMVILRGDRWWTSDFWHS